MKKISKRLFSTAVALVLSLGMATGNGAKVANASDFSYGENTDMGITEVVKPIEMPVVYSPETTIEYCAGETYSMEIYMRTTYEVASYQMSIEVPWFMNVVEVEMPYGLKMSDYDVFDWEKTDNGFNVSYSSPYDRVGDFEIVSFTYTIASQGNYNDFIRANSYMFTDANANEVFNVGFQFGMISVVSNGGAVKVMKGDANLDGVVDLQDIIVIQRAIVEESTYRMSSDSYNASDINNDGAINIKDCQYIQMYLVGAIDSLENVNGGSGDSGEVDGEVFPLHLSVRNQYGEEFFNTSTSVSKGATYREVFRPIFIELEKMYRITQYLSAESRVYGYYSNVEEASSLIVESDDYIVVQVSVEYGGEVEKNNASLIFCYEYDGEYIPLNEEEVYIPDGNYIYDYIMVEESDGFGAFAEIVGIYYDAECKEPVGQTDMASSQVNVFVVVESVSVAGITFDLIEENVSLNGKYEENTVGTIYFTEDMATVTYNGETYSAPYSNMVGVVSVYRSEYSLLCVNLDSCDGKNQAYIGVNFDGSDLEEREEFARVAGEYTVSGLMPVTAGLILYTNGAWKISVADIALMGNYELSDNGVILYMYGYPMEFIYDGETNSFSPNNNGGGSGDVASQCEIYVEVYNQNGDYIYNTYVYAPHGASYDYVMEEVYYELYKKYEINGVNAIISDYYGKFPMEQISELVVNSSDRVQLYVTVGEYGEQENNATFMAYYLYNGEYVCLDGTNFYMPEDVTIYETVMTKMLDWFGEYAYIEGIYYDEEFTKEVSESDMPTSNTYVYITISSRTIAGGSYDLVEEYWTSNGERVETVVGSVSFNNAQATVTYKGETYTDFYHHMLGQVSILKGSYSMLGVELENGKAYIEYQFDGSNYQDSEEYREAQGEYKVNGLDFMTIDLTLYTNGVYKLSMLNIVQLGNYEISENGFILYMDGDGLEIIYDAESGCYVPNYNNGENDNVIEGGSGSVDIGASYDISLVYGEYYQYADDGTTARILHIDENGFEFIEYGEVTASGTEMYAMVVSNMAQVSLFVSDVKGLTVMIDLSSGYFDFSEYDASNLPETEEYRAVAGFYRLVVDGMDYGITYELKANGLVIGTQGGYKAVDGYCVITENVIEISNGLQFLIDKESKTITPIQLVNGETNNSIDYTK